ncbi:MAG TPA: phosphodiesterase [Nitrospiraceae bacterium]|nr:phosphodiesterase [Nitrospiraceae bacterium]
MIKKINVNELIPGMFISDFNCTWLQHPFLNNNVKVKDEKIINKICEYGIREVYIDTDKGLDVAHAQTEKEMIQQIQTEIEEVIESATEDTVHKKQTSFKEELVNAGKVIEEASQTVKNIMEDIKLGKQLNIETANEIVLKMIDSIIRNKDALVSLGRIRKKDEYTFMHSVNVCVLMVAFSKHLGYDDKTIELLGMGGLLHDIGKMRIPLSILNKPYKLTAREYDIVKVHVKDGCDILAQSPGISETSFLVTSHHHERLDGTGYPRGLKGEEISDAGKMAAIADMYDAMTSDRCYKMKILPTSGLRELYELRGIQLDDVMVQEFIRCFGIYPVGTLVRLKSGLLAIVIDNSDHNLLQPKVRVIYDANKEEFIRMPYEIDLSQSSGDGGADSITNYESPERIHIHTLSYLP